MSTSEEWDPAAQDGLTHMLRDMNPDERAELIREACPDLSEDEVRAWANDQQRRPR